MKARVTLTPFWLAVSLLTTLPVGRWLPARIAPIDQGRSVVCYPLVGAIIGALVALAAALAATAPPLIGAALVLVVWVALTGALHLDGLADATDGWFAGHRDPTRCLQVMAEPTAGPMAIVVLVGVLLSKFAALAVLLAAGPPFAVLVAVPLLARAAAGLYMATTVYRRTEGIAKNQAATRSRGAIVLATLVALVVCLGLLAPARGALLAVIVTGVTAGWRRLWQGRIGGYTGDIVGAQIELVECIALAGLAWAAAGPGNGNVLWG